MYSILFMWQAKLLTSDNHVFLKNLQHLHDPASIARIVFHCWQEPPHTLQNSVGVTNISVKILPAVYISLLGHSKPLKRGGNYFIAPTSRGNLSCAFH